MKGFILEELLKELKKRNDLGFYVDMGYEFYIYKGKAIGSKDPEELYRGNIFSFIEDLMIHFNVRDDRTI